MNLHAVLVAKAELQIQCSWLEPACKCQGRILCTSCVWRQREARASPGDDEGPLLQLAGRRPLSAPLSSLPFLEPPLWGFGELC